MAPYYLDQIPLDFSHPTVKELRNLLYENYFRSAEVMALVRAAGVPPAWINWDQPMVLVWDDLLSTLHKQGRLRRLLQNMIESPDTALARRLRELTADQPVTAASVPANGDIAMRGPALGDYEKIIAGESTLLDVSLVQRDTELALAVVRLLVTLDGQPFFGTAFRIGEHLLLTSHHVLFAASGRPGAAVDVWFGYERAFGGQPKAYVSVPGQVETTTGEPVHDWAVIRLIVPAPEGVPVIRLTGAVPAAVDDRVYII